VLLGQALAQPWLCWFGGGYATHLLADALTDAGIPLWSPFSSKRTSLSPLRTASSSEYVLAAVLLVFTCLFGWHLLPEHIKHTHRVIIFNLSGIDGP
jgi:membrane-bound metal-dependent hydrolase YbcI (DUF457 family)